MCEDENYSEQLTKSCVLKKSKQPGRMPRLFTFIKTGKLFSLVAQQQA
jgi:hypothetical protein